MIEDFRKLWRGEHPLGTALALHFGVGTGFILFLVTIIARPVLDLPDEMASHLTYGAGLAYACFAAVGVWRSSQRGERSRWQIINSRVLVCMLVLQLGFLAVHGPWSARYGHFSIRLGSASLDLVRRT